MLNPPSLTLFDLIEGNWAESNPAKAEIIFLKFTTNIDWASMLAPRSAGRRYLWVTEGDSPHRAIAFQAQRVDLDLVVNIFLRANSRAISDLEEAGTEERNMIEEVSRIIAAERDSITEFTPTVKNPINKDDGSLDPPLFAHEIHVKCVYVRSS